MPAKPTPPSPGNLQGILYKGFTHPFSAHLAFQFPEESNPRRFVKALLPKVQSAESWGDQKPASLVQVGFTHSGLKALKVPDVKADLFPIEYRMGPTNYYSQQSLKDLGESAPVNWTFGSTPANRVDMMVHLYALTQAAYEELLAKVSAAASAAGVAEFLPAGRRYTANPGLAPFIHFGYRDGISQPDLHWPSPWPAGDTPTPQDASNNFVIGYPNSALIPGPVNTPDGTGAFAKDGYFNVFRVFFQDVSLFERFLKENAPVVMSRLGCREDEAREWLAAKMNGRWKDGTPLTLSPDRPDPTLQEVNNFDFSSDVLGKKCPFASHIRVTQPRGQKMFSQTEDPLPRIIRRGVAYGSKPMPPAYKGEQGLIGMFLCGSISQQFEKICGWMNATNASPVFSFTGIDPLLGNHSTPLTAHRFEIPMQNGGPLVLDLTGYQFVVTRGTAYTFMPSIAALGAIASLA